MVYAGSYIFAQMMLFLDYPCIPSFVNILFNLLSLLIPTVRLTHIFWGENEKIANEILPALVPALSLGRNGSKSVLRGGVAKEKRVP